MAVLRKNLLNLLIILALVSARSDILLHEVASDSWWGDILDRIDISFTDRVSHVLQCAARAAKRLLSDQLLVFVAGRGAGEMPQCIVASRRGAACHPLMPLIQPSPCCIRVFVKSLSGCLTSIQRRVDSSTNFYRNWTEYAAGFGQGPHGNHWIGLRAIHNLTWPSGRPLRIRMKLWNDTVYWANYTKFLVDSEVNKFRATISGFFGSPNIGDCMSSTNGKSFSTFDSDNDVYDSNCSAKFRGGWWYSACHCTNPNGLYFNRPEALNTPAYATGVVWSIPFGHYYSMREFEMLRE